MYPSPPSFRSSAPNSAWWMLQPRRVATVGSRAFMLFETEGLPFVLALQAELIRLEILSRANVNHGSRALPEDIQGVLRAFRPSTFRVIDGQRAPFTQPMSELTRYALESNIPIPADAASGANSREQGEPDDDWDGNYLGTEPLPRLNGRMDDRTMRSLGAWVQFMRGWDLNMRRWTSPAERSFVADAQARRVTIASLDIACAMVQSIAAPSLFFTPCALHSDTIPPLYNAPPPRPSAVHPLRITLYLSQ